MSWPTVPMKWITTLTAGGTPSVDEPTYWATDEGGHAWVAISDMSSVDTVTTTARRVTDSGLRSARMKLGEPGTILFSMYASLGHTALLKIPAAWNQAILGLSPDKTTDRGFLRYSLVALRPHLSEQAKSNTQANLTAELVANLPIPRPSLDEQCRIANFLDAETARIDNVQSVRERQLAGLEELILSQISAALPDESQAPFVRLGYLSIIQSGITVDSGRDSGPDSTTLPYLRVANVQNGHLDLKSMAEITVPRSMARSAMLRCGDVLMTEGGDLDKLGRGTVWHGEIENCLHQNHVFAVRPDQRVLLPEYLALLTRTAYARSYFESTGTKTTNLASTSSSKIRDFRAPLIDIEDQARISRETDSWLKGIAKLGDALRQQKALMTERKQALITAAVTGQIDVTTARGGVA
jgi:type I restriction enzyme, S subunit